MMAVLKKTLSVGLSMVGFSLLAMILLQIHDRSVVMAEEERIPVSELISFEDLDKMETFPGNLGALPEVSIPEDNLKTT